MDIFWWVVVLWLLILSVRSAGQKSLLARMREELEALRQEMRELRAGPAEQGDSPASGVSAESPVRDLADDVAVTPAPAAVWTPPQAPDDTDFAYAPDGQAPPAAGMPPQASVARQAQPPFAASAAALVWQWFKRNPLLYSGLCVFLTGIAFALGYLAKRGMFSMEARFAMVGLAGLAMSAIGWWLRKRNALYGLSLMGGGAVVLYFVLFMATRVQLLPVTSALWAMVALVFAASLLALAADAEILAALSSLGGFMAPVLLSTQSGNHIALFGYFALLTLGNAALLRYKSWDVPALISFAAVYGIGGLWGFTRYEPDMLLSVELFLLLFFAAFTYMQIQLARHADLLDARSADAHTNEQHTTFPEAPSRSGRLTAAALRSPAARRYMHASLLFGLPLLTFVYQYHITLPYEYMPAFSALALAVWHVGLGRLLRYRTGAALTLTREALLILGLGFSILCVPLSLNAKWTSCVWAVQGLGLAWLGLRQNRLPLRVMGYLLQGLAACSHFSGLLRPEQPEAAPLTSGLLIALCAFALLELCRRHGDALTTRPEQNMAVPLQIWGMLWWLGTGIHELGQHFAAGTPVWGNAALSFVSVSCLLWMWAGTRLNQRVLAAAGHLLLPALLVFGPHLLWRLLHLLQAWPQDALNHPPSLFAAVSTLPALCLAYAVAFFHFRRAPFAGIAAWRSLCIHVEINGFFMAACVMMSYEASVRLNELISHFPLWISPPLALCIAVWLFPLSRPSLPLKLRPGQQMEDALASLRKWSGLALSLWLIFWFVRYCFLSGYAAPLPHIPLLAPLDIAQALCLLSVLLWLRAVRGREWSQLKEAWLYWTFGGCAFAFCTVAAARAVAHYTFGVFFWKILLASPVFQCAISLLWGIIALSMILLTVRVFKNRTLWLTGAGLLALTLCKLLIFDLADRQTIYRVISFLVLGVLMLIVGYFCPLPPKNRPASAPLPKADFENMGSASL